MHNERSPLSLSDIVAPLSAETFLAEVYQKRWKLMPGPEGRFADLYGWADVNGLLKHGRVEYPLIRLMKAGKGIVPTLYSEERYRTYGDRRMYREIVPARLERQLRDGATLVLGNVSRTSHRLNEFCRALERDLDTGININLYAGWRSDNGFAKHWDDHDVFILQIAGRKKWEIYPDTRPKPLNADPAAQRIPGRPLWTGLLTQGDCLYIPRGFWHVAYPLDEPSLHLTTGLGTVAGEAVLGWLGRRLLASEAFRRDVPVIEGPAGVDRYFAELRGEIDRLLAPGMGDEFLAHREEKALGSLDTGLPGSAGTGAPPAAPARLEMASARKRRIRPVPNVPYVSMAVSGRTRRFRAGFRGMLEHLARGGRATVDELAARCDDSVAETEIRGTIRELFQEGVLRVVPGDLDTHAPASPRAPERQVE